MREETKKLLDELANTQWFSAVGEPLEIAGVKVAASWKDAVASCSSDPWERTTAINRVRLIQAADKFPERAKPWNEIVREIKSILLPLIAERVDSLLSKEELPRKPLEDDIGWVLLHACLEQEFGDIVDQGFFSDLVSWYLGGRFPCGWDPEDNGGNEHYRHLGRHVDAGRQCRP